MRNHGYMIYDYAVRARRQSSGQAADGRQVDDLGRQAHLDASPCATASNSTTARRSRAEARRAVAEALGRSRDPAGSDAVDQGSPTVKADRSPRPSRSCSRRRPASCCRRSASRRAMPSSCRSGWPRPMPSSRSTDTIGSGPFIFVKDEWKPGDKTVYVKNPKYKPRSEPASRSGRRQDRQGRPRRMGRRCPTSRLRRNAAAQGRDRHDRERRSTTSLKIMEADPRRASWSNLNMSAATSTSSASTSLHHAVRQRPRSRQAAELRLQPEGLSRRRDRRCRASYKTCKAMFMCDTPYARPRAGRRQVRGATSTRPGELAEAMAATTASR